MAIETVTGNPLLTGEQIGCRATCLTTIKTCGRESVSDIDGTVTWIPV